MEKKSYAELLKDPRWQKKRLEIMQRDNFTCQLCGSKDKTLHVHHLWYSVYKNPWEYNNNDLITLCDDCHQRTHQDIKYRLIDKNVKIGLVYKFYHGDFTDYMICYDIDKEKGTIYMMGIDDGGGYDSLWFEIFELYRFIDKCDYCGQFFNEEYDEDYFQHSLFYVFYMYAFNRKISIYDEEIDNRDVRSILWENMPLIFENNPELKTLFAKALIDESSVINY